MASVTHDLDERLARIQLLTQAIEKHKDAVEESVRLRQTRSRRPR